MFCFLNDYFVITICNTDSFKGNEKIYQGCHTHLTKTHLLEIDVLRYYTTLNSKQELSKKNWNSTNRQLDNGTEGSTILEAVCNTGRRKSNHAPVVSSAYRKKTQQQFAGNCQNLMQPSSCITASSLPVHRLTIVNAWAVTSGCLSYLQLESCSISPDAKTLPGINL